MNAASNIRNISRAIAITLFITLTSITTPYQACRAEETRETLTAANSGLLVISRVCEESSIFITSDEAKKLANIDRGRISLLGIKNALKAKGLQVEGISADIESLKTLAGQGTVITIINKGCHFVIVLDVTESAVKIYDPSVDSKTFDYSLDLFKNDWSGKVFLVKNSSENTAYSAAAATAVSRERSGNTRALSSSEMQSEEASPACKNALLDSGLPWWLKLLLSADPVVLANGNLSSAETDFLIETKGIIPLEITRTYNSQSPAMLDRWTPEPGAGPWRIVHGEYCGHGDRSISNFKGGGYTLTLRMKTITAGTNEPWMTARVNFNYRNADNTYYVLIGTNGKVELGRVIDGLYYVISHNTDLSPTSWNTVKVVSNADYTKVYFNNRTMPEFNVPTSSMLKEGKIALEACFSHCHFDDVVFTPNNHDPIISDFKASDEAEPFGMNWTYTYGMRLEWIGHNVTVIMPDDRRPVFTGPPVGGVYKSPKGIYDTLSVTAAGFTLTEKDGAKYIFDLTGRLNYIEDRFKNRNTLYYEGNLLKRVTDSSLRSLTFDYSSDGKISAITDPKGNKYRYIYKDNQLTEVIYPGGNSKYYDYDPLDQVRTKYTDREGNEYEYSYTYNLKVASQKDPDGNRTKFDYYWATTHVSNRDNELWQYTIDPNSLLQKEVKDNIGSSTTYYWTPDKEYPGEYISEIEHTQDQYGRKTFYLYDERGNRKWIKDPELNVTEFTYSADYNQLTRKKDPGGNITNYVYDKGMLIRIEEPLAKTTTMEYYDCGKLKKLIGSNSNITEYEYDSNGYTKKIKYYTETAVIEKSFTYDIIGNLTSETDEEGNVTNYVYDANNNLLQVKDSSGNILSSYT